jgi:hypothetical protein
MLDLPHHLPPYVFVFIQTPSCNVTIILPTSHPLSDTTLQEHLEAPQGNKLTVEVLDEATERTENASKDNRQMLTKVTAFASATQNLLHEQTKWLL